MIEPYYSESGITIYCGDCREILPGLNNDIDTVVTDPPYHLTADKRGGSGASSLNENSPAGRARIRTGFMGKAWDGGDVAFQPETWRAVMRVCKPGAFLLAFGGTRTFHRLTCAIEDAGWEIRDCIMWLYGSGFPKSLDISKAIDKTEDYKFQSAVRRAAVEAVEAAGLKLPGNSRWDWTVGEHAPGAKWWGEFKSWIPELTDEQRRRVEGEIVARVRKTAGWFTSRDIYTVTVPSTDAAKLWNGWGSALKPAYEPIIVAMKPLDGTFAQNALAHGVAGLNIDGGRIHTEGSEAKEYTVKRLKPGATLNKTGGNWRPEDGADFNGTTKAGRWPANIVLDEEAAAQLDEMSGTLNSGSSHLLRRGKTTGSGIGYGSGSSGGDVANATYGDSGGASRFFYTAKASKEDRGADNNHPTVKPTSLLKYLCKLTATPSGGKILDPFRGSGSILKAAQDYGRPVVGIELDADYCRIQVNRLRQGVLNFQEAR